MYFKYLLPALSAGSAYLQDFTEEAVAAKCTPFNALIVKNDGFCLLEVSINGKVVDNINSKGAKVFSTAIYSFGVKNKEAIPTLSDTVKAYVMNTEAIQTTDEGTILAHDIDKQISVSDTEAPLVTTSDAQRFADWYEIYVKSYGDLTPGEHKIYFGSGTLTKEFVNVYSKYTFPEKSGKHWDLNEMKIKCDNPYPLTTPDNGGFELGNLTNWTNSGEANAQYVCQQGAKHSGGNAGGITVINLLPFNPYHSYSFWYHKVGAITSNDAYLCSIWLAATGPRAAYFRCIREVGGVVQYDTPNDVKYHFETNNGWQNPSVMLPESSFPTLSTTGITMRVGFLKDARTTVNDVMYPDDFQFKRQLGSGKPIVNISGAC